LFIDTNIIADNFKKSNSSKADIQNKRHIVLYNRNIVLFSADIHLYQPFPESFEKNRDSGEGKHFPKVFLPPKKALATVQKNICIK